MKRITQIIILVLLISSCRKDAVLDVKSKYPVIGSGSFFDISEVKSFITKTSGLYLYKITDNSGLDEVKFIDIYGDPIFDTIKTYVTNVYSLSHDFIVFEGSFVSLTGESKYNSVLFSRSDSVFHEFPDEVDLGLSWHFLLSSDFQKDNNNGVFYYNRVFPKNVTSLSLSNLTSKDILPQSFDNIEFLTTGVGDCMYRTDFSQDIFTVVFNEGGSGEFTIDVPIPDKFVYEGMENTNKMNEGFWQGPDNEIYLLTGWMKSPPVIGMEEIYDVMDIYKISFNNKQIVYELKATVDDLDVVEFLSINRDEQYKTFRGDYVYIVNKSSQGFLGITGWAFNHNTGHIMELSLPFRRDIISFSHSNNYMFLGLDDDIIRISYENFSYSSLLSGRPDSYFVSKLGASGEDDVYFEAIRSSDSRRVIGVIDKFGSLTYLDESLKGEVAAFIGIH